MFKRSLNCTKINWDFINKSRKGQGDKETRERVERKNLLAKICRIVGRQTADGDDWNTKSTKTETET